MKRKCEMFAMQQGRCLLCSEKVMNYRAAKQTLQNGAKSGNGCSMLIYDNAVLTIIQNY